MNLYPTTDSSNEANHAEAAQIGYAEAVEELNAIQQHLDDDNLDIDVLTELVERAAFLIKVCQDRISTAQARFEKIAPQLTGTATPSQNPTEVEHSTGYLDSNQSPQQHFNESDCDPF